MPRQCFWCGQLGHIKRFCKNPSTPIDQLDTATALRLSKFVGNEYKPMREIKFNEGEFTVMLSYFRFDNKTILTIKIKKGSRILLHESLI